jgi:FkbM family methyltransferase
MSVGFSKAVGLVRAIPIVGPALRRWVRRYPEGSVVRIWAGEAKGLKWKRSHRYDPSFWMGTHEPPLQRVLASVLRPGDVFYDVGANAGFFSLLAAKLVGRRGAVVAFEPHPDNVRSIHDQARVNGFDQIVVVPKAVSAKTGKITFCASRNLSRGHIGAPASGEELIEVDAIALDDLLEETRPPTVIKIDIEGGGVELVKGARAVAERHTPVWVLEVHNVNEEVAFKQLLLPLGYRFESLDRTPVLPAGPLPNHVIAMLA